MDDQNLDRLLAQRRDSPLPALPTTLQQDVWREIRRRKRDAAKPSGAWFDWLLEPLFRPTMAFAAMTFALVLGVSLGTTASASSRNTQTRVAFDLQVFGSSSPALPATLMGYAR